MLEFYVTHRVTFTSRHGATVHIELLQALSYVPASVINLPILEDDSAFEVEFRSSNAAGEGVMSYTYRPYIYATTGADLYRILASGQSSYLFIRLLSGSKEVFRGFPDYQSLEKDMFSETAVFTANFIDGMTFSRKASFGQIRDQIRSNSGNPYHQLGTGGVGNTPNRIPFADLIAEWIFQKYTYLSADIVVLQRFVPRVSTTTYDLITRFFVSPLCWSESTKINDVVAQLAISFGLRIGYSHTFEKLCFIEQRPALPAASANTLPGKSYDASTSLRSGTDIDIPVQDALPSYIIERIDDMDVVYNSDFLDPVKSATYRESVALDKQLNPSQDADSYEDIVRSIPFAPILTSASNSGAEVLTNTSPNTYAVPTFFNHPDINFPVSGWLSSVFASFDANDPNDTPYFSSWRFRKRMRVKVSLFFPTLFDPMLPIRMKVLGLVNAPLFQPVSGRLNVLDETVIDLEAIEVRNFNLDPTSISSLAMWLKSDTGVTLAGTDVTAWLDQSGNGVDAIQTTPTNRPVFMPEAIEGFPAVLFSSASNHVLEIDNVSFVTAQKTVFIVYQASPQTSRCVMALGTGSSRQAIYSDPMSSVSGGGFERCSIASQSWRVLALRQPSADVSDGLFYLNGKLLTPVEFVARGFTQGTGGHIGAVLQGGVLTGYLDGGIAEIIVYTASLSEPETIAISESLMQKYRIGY